MLKPWNILSSHFATAVRNWCISLHLWNLSNLWVSWGALGSWVPDLRTANLDNLNTPETLLCQQELHKLCLDDSPTTSLIRLWPCLPCRHTAPFATSWSLWLRCCLSAFAMASTWNGPTASPNCHSAPLQLVQNWPPLPVYTIQLDLPGIPLVFLHIQGWSSPNKPLWKYDYMWN